MNKKYILEYTLLFLVILVTIAGFWEIYFGEDSNPTLYHHLHIITNFIWLMLLVYQLHQIANNNFSNHHKIGISILLIGPLLFATTALLSVHSAHKGLVSGKGDALLVQNVTVTIELGLLIALAFIFKKQRKLHGAFLMSTSILFMGIALFFTFLSFVPLFKIEGPETFYRFGTSAATAGCICIVAGLIFFLKSRKYGWPLLLAGLFPFFNEFIKHLLTGGNLIQPLTEVVGSFNPFITFFSSFIFLSIILLSTGIQKKKELNSLSKSFILVSLIFCSACSVKQEFNYPVTRTEPFDTTIFDTKISDPYFWMSRKGNEKELMEWVNAQGKLTQSVLDSIPNSEILMAEIEDGYIKMQDEIWALEVVNEKFYYYRDIPEVGPSLCRRNNLDAEEEIIFGRSIIINGETYRSRKSVYAHKKPLVAMMLIQRGEANPHVRIYDLDKKTFLSDSIAPVMFNDSRGVSMTWLPDDSGLLYTQAPPSTIESEKYYNGKIKLHKLGESVTLDEAVFGIGLHASIQLKDFETPYIYSFKSSDYLLARIRNGADDNYAFAVHYKDLKGANTPWKRLNNYVNLGDGFDARDQFLYAATKDHPRYNIVQIDMSTGNSPVKFIPAQDEVFSYVDAAHSSGIVAGKDALYVMFRKVGDMGIYKINYESKQVSKIHLNGKHSIAEFTLKDDNDLVFAQFNALRSVQYMIYEHGKNSVMPLPFSKISLDLSNDFVTEVLEVPSRDGKKIPVSLVYKKDIALNGKNPLLIQAYGNSGAVTDLGLDPNNLPWLNRGGISAYAHVRGGGELGLEWIDDGQFPNKMNSINDIVDVAEYFVKNNYTSADKQFVMGGSAGSFLVGNSINQRPDLYAGGIFQAGLPDLVTYRDAAYARERGSVGDIATKEGFESMYNLSALFHIPTNKKLPAMLVVHGATDYIIDLTSPARYVATLQARQKGDRPQLFMVDWEGGHTGSGMDEMINTLKFMLWQSGHPEFQPNKN